GWQEAVNMNREQLATLAQLLELEEAVSNALCDVLIHGRDAADAALAHGCNGPVLLRRVDQLRAADQRIRQAYVVHGPTEFRVMVGHHSHGRLPGVLKLQVGQIVRLVAHSTERWIPVRITALPENRHDYYRGTIVEQLARYSKFQAGNGAMFSEDQVA